MDTLNQNILNLNNNKNEINWNPLIILPLLQYMITNNYIEKDDLENIISKKNILKLRFYKFSDFVRVSDKIEDYLSEFTDKLSELLPYNVDLQSIEFLLYEIFINIYKHSKFKNAYIELDICENEENINICIIDDGIGIPGSFREVSINFENDCNAIYGAINGETSDKEKFHLHGRGLNSTVRITTLGFGGEILIASGNGICIIKKEGAKTFLNDNRINGTFIILKIPNKKIDDIYKYLRYCKINKITEVNNE